MRPSSLDASRLASSLAALTRSATERITSVWAPRGVSSSSEGAARATRREPGRCEEEGTRAGATRTVAPGPGPGDAATRASSSPERRRVQATGEAAPAASHGGRARARGEAGGHPDIARQRGGQRRGTAHLRERVRLQPGPTRQRLDFGRRAETGKMWRGFRASGGGVIRRATRASRQDARARPTRSIERHDRVNLRRFGTPARVRFARLRVRHRAAMSTRTS